MSDEAEVVNAPAVFSGEAFYEARQRLGLSIEQVARQLHLSEKIVHSIEQSSLEQLKDPVFIRGYIRSYARFLKLDADALVAAYNQQTGNVTTTAQVRPIGTLSTGPGRRQGHPVLRVGTWLFILALVAASIWWWQTQFGFDADERPALDDLPVSVETTDGTTLVLPQLAELEAEVGLNDELQVQPAIPGAGEEAMADPEPEIPVSEAAREIGVDSPAEPEALPTVDETAQQPEVDAVAADESYAGLVLKFTDDCWLSVKDARGRNLYSGVAKGGSSLELDGEQPLAVVIGRVSAVAEMRYANKVIDLAAHSKENVARLSLPL